MIPLWHNPRSSKSRQALALLEDAGAQVSVRKYLEDAPNAAEIAQARAALGTPPLIDMMRRGEKLFKELGLSTTSTEEALLEAMISHPILIERPLAIKGNRAVIARPPQHVAALL